MLIDSLRKHPSLSAHICSCCSERGFAVDIDLAIQSSSYIIIKVDGYYNANYKSPPPSPDCLIVQKCKDNTYSIFLIELRDISDSHGFQISNIRLKFETCLYDFMGSIFKEFFVDLNFNFKKIELIFVTDPYKEAQKGSRHRHDRTTKIDALLAMNTKPLRFNQKLLGIQHKIANPIINPC